MFSIIRTFTFWLITGIIVALVITVVIPKFKTQAVEKIPGSTEALKIINQAKTAVKNLPDSLDAFKAAPESEQISGRNVKPASREEPELRATQDSAAVRDDKLFKRQCAILDDLL